MINIKARNGGKLPQYDHRKATLRRVLFRFDKRFVIRHEKWAELWLTFHKYVYVSVCEVTQINFLYSFFQIT